MPQVWLLLKGAAQTAQAVPVIAQLFEEPGSSYIKAKLDHQSHDVIESAKLATKLTYRILRSEGYLTQSTVVRYRLENAPENINGHSGGLAFALTFATKALHRQHFKSVAATGILEEQGSVTRVEGFLEKLQTALATLPPDSQLLYPEGNADDIDQTVHQQAKAGQVELIAVNNLEEAFARIGIQLKKVYTYAPYRGLEAFQFEHAGTFFGRSNEVRALCQQLDERAETHHPSILVLGASGSGKSSMVLAGVLPELVQGTAWPSNVQTLWSVFRPRDVQASPNSLLSAQPELERLYQAVAASWHQALSLNGISDPQTWEAKTLITWLNSAVTNYPKTNTQEETRFVWVIDQLEELFTLGFQPDTVRQFSEFLVELPQTGIWLILTLRSDYYPHYQSQPALLNHFRDNGTFDLLPIEGEAIEQIIREPAWVSDSQFERDAANVSLASRIQRDADNQPGILPLLEFTLTELYQGRDKQQRLFTYQAYEAMGGLKSSIGHRAETLYQALGDASKKAIPSLIRGLSFVANESKGITARPVPLDNYPEGTKKRAVIDRMTEARLLIKEGKENNHTQIRVAHEALLTHWERAKQQIDKERRDLVLMQQLEEQSKRWQVTKEKNQTSLLLHAGLPLTEAVDLQERFEEDLPVEVRNYIQASQQAEHSRTATEKRQRKLRSRLRNLAMMIIVVTAIFAGWQWQVAEERRRQAELEKNRADEQTTEAIARQLAAQSKTEFSKNTPTGFIRANLLAIESLKHKHTIDGYLAWAETANLLPESVKVIPNDCWAPALAVDPKSRWIATGDSCNEVKIWDINSGEIVVAFSHDDKVFDVDFSPNGELIASASEDKSVRIWDIKAGKEIARIEHKDIVRSARFSEDGKFLLTQGHEPIVRIINTNNWQVQSELKHEKSVYRAVWSPNGTKVATISDKIVRVWDSKSTSILFEISHNDCESCNPDPSRSSKRTSINFVKFSPDNAYLSTSAYDGTVRIWDSNSGAERHTLIHRFVISEFRLMSKFEYRSDGLLLATESPGLSAVRLWNTETGKELLRFDTTVGNLSLDFSSDDEMLLSLEAQAEGNNTDGGFIKIWKLRTQREVFRLALESVVSKVLFTRGDTHVVTSGRNIRIWKLSKPKRKTDSLSYQTIFGKPVEIRQGELPQKFPKEIDPISGILVASKRDGKEKIYYDSLSGKELGRSLTGYSRSFHFATNRIALLYFDKQNVIDIWDMVLNKPILNLNHDSKIVDAMFNHDGNKLATLTADIEGKSKTYTLYVWDLKTAKLIAKFKPLLSPLSFIFNKNGSLLIVQGWDSKKVLIWDIEKEKVVYEIKHVKKITSMTISPNLRFLITSSTDQTVKVWDIENKINVTTLTHDNEVKMVTFSNDGARLLSVQKNNTLILWDVQTWNKIRQFEQDDKIRQVFFNQDDTHFLSMGLGGFDPDSSIHLWNVASGEELVRLRPEETGIRSFSFAQFSIDDNSLVVWGQNFKAQREVSLWLWKTADLISKSCNALSRNFTKDEWRLYFGQKPYQETCPGLSDHNDPQEKILNYSIWDYL